MLLKNYYNHLASVMLDKAANYTTTSGAMGATNQSTSYTASRFRFTYLNSVETERGGSGVVFGTGDTSPALDDYFLSGDIITTLSGNGAVSTTFDETGCTIESLLTVTNTGNEAVTIREVGYINTYGGTAMLDRTVLESPVTIEPGGVGQITYTIRMNYPTA